MSHVSEVDSGVPDASGGLNKIRSSFDRWDAKAMRYQKLRQPLIVVAIALGPVAVLLLSIQALAFPQGGATAVTLIALELAALTVALWFGFLGVGRSTHGRWINCRLRSELLRREQFLFRARVGPYLGQEDARLSDKVDRRLLALNSMVTNPIACVPMSDSEGNWRDRFEVSSVAAIPCPDLAFRATDYLENRVKDQRQYFEDKSPTHRHRSEMFENAARITLTVALIIAGLHLGFIAADGTGSSGLLHKGLVILAIVLPALGGAFASLQSASGSLRLHQSYEYYVGELLALEQALLDLTQTDRSDAVLSADLERRFQRIVLSVEQLLSDELRLWWMIMATKGPKAAL